MKKIPLVLTIIFLAGLGIAIRLLPHPANFAPIAAIALFCGYYLPKKWAVLLPLSVMLVSDLFIGFYDLRLLAVVYGCFALIGLVGLFIRKRRQLITIITATLFSSLAFFLLTNLAVFLFSSWYPHTWSGLMLCYTLAVPFFKNTLMGDLFFTGVLFGSYELMKQVVRHKIKFFCLTSNHRKNEGNV